MGAMLEAWSQHIQQPRMTRESSVDTALVPVLKGKGRQSVCREVLVLLKRQVTVAYRDPTVYSGRMLMSVLTCLIFSLIYMKSRDRVQTQVLPRQWLISWIIGIPTLLSMVYCFAAGDEFTAVLKEVRANNYRLCSYLFAQMLVQLPVMVLLALLSTLPSGFGIGGWSFQAFFAIRLDILFGVFYASKEKHL